MAEKETNIPNHELSSNDLAFERTALGENRTLMAWIRTAISMISFGFTIYKFFHETKPPHEGETRFLTPRLVGMVMMTFGLICLFMGLIEHRAMIKKLKKSYPTLHKSNISILAVLILMFGLILFLGALFRQ